MGRYGSHVEQTYRNAFGLKSRKALTGSNLMSHLPSASLVNREDGDERYRRNSLYFDSLFQGTQV